MTSTDLRHLSTERPSTGPRVLKALAVVVVGAGGLFLAAWAAFFALVLVTGCFIGCSPPTTGEVLGGLVLGGGAAVLAAAGPLLAAALYRSRGWLVASGVVVALALLAQLLVGTGS